MIIYFRDIFDEDFIENVVPEIIISRVKSLASKPNAQRMNEYLRKYFNLTINEVIDQVQFKINKYGNVYSLAIDNVAVEKKTKDKLMSYVHLIDFGNIEVKGLNMFNSSMNYIKDNLKEIYRYYQIQEGRLDYGD